MTSTTDSALDALKAFLDRLLSTTFVSKRESRELVDLDMLIQQASYDDPRVEGIFRGVFHALNDDHEASMMWHRRAIELNPSNPHAHAAQAVSLDIFGNCGEAAEAALRAVKLGDERSVFPLILYAYRAGRNDMLEVWLPRFALMAGEEHPVAVWIRQEADILDDEYGACECHFACHASGMLNDWDHPDEEAAWRHLQ